MERIAWVGSTLVLLGIIGTLLAPQIQNPTLYTLVSHLGSICIGAGLVELVMQFVAVRHLVRRVSSQLIYTLQLPLEVFYENRSALPSWSQELNGVSEVWFAWHTGTVQGASGLINIINQTEKTRLLVTHPDSKSLEEIAKIGTRSKAAMQYDIKELTKKARENGIKVRWFDGPIGNSIIIGNPSSPNAWARIELMIPYIEPTARPNIQVSMDKGKGAFQTILDGYKNLWNNSVEPPDKIF
jgi:hypothetical protein